MSYFQHLKAVMVTLVRNAMAKNIEYLIDKGTRQKKSVENSPLGSGPKKKNWKKHGLKWL